MLSGNIILAHPDGRLADGVQHILCYKHPSIHIERATEGRNVLMMQSFMRADAVLMDMNLPDMPGAHLIHELKSDIVNPYVLVCSGDRSRQAERQALRMGANGYYAAPVNVENLCRELEAYLKMRFERAKTEQICLAEAMLQRVFVEYGIPSDLKGYAYLKYAVRLLSAGEASLESVGALYERIGERFGCSAASIERGIRYAVVQCSERAGDAVSKKRSNKQFIALLIEECRSANPTLIAPRVSVFASGRRVFK